MVHRVLKLQHHRHTAKRLPHAHTSYRGLFVVLALMALCLGAWQQVRADDYTVSATVPSGSLTQPAVITSHASGTVVQSSTVEIRGTCQVVINGTIVVLTRNGTNLGSQACSSDGKFAITITLQPGENPIVPKVFTSSNVPGPDGPTVMLIRPTGTGSVTSRPGSVKALGLRLDSPFLVYQSGEPARLTVTPEGGVAPYKLRIDWGDGSRVEEWKMGLSGAGSYEHRYKANNAYKIILVLEDARGEQYRVELTAISLAAPVLNLVAPKDPLAGVRAWFASPVTRIVWGTYGVISVLTVSLWWISPNHTLLWNGTAPGRPLFKRRA